MLDFKKLLALKFKKVSYSIYLNLARIFTVLLALILLWLILSSLSRTAIGVELSNNLFDKLLEY